MRTHARGTCRQQDSSTTTATRTRSRPSSLQPPPCYPPPSTGLGRGVATPFARRRPNRECALTRWEPADNKTLRPQRPHAHGRAPLPLLPLSSFATARRHRSYARHSPTCQPTRLNRHQLRPPSAHHSAGPALRYSRGTKEPSQRWRGGSCMNAIAAALCGFSSTRRLSRASPAVQSRMAPTALLKISGWPALTISIVVLAFSRARRSAVVAALACLRERR